MFHAQNSFELLAVNVSENIAVMDFAGARFFAAWVIANLEVGNFREGAVDVGDEVSLGDLLMINVEEDFARRAADRFANHVGLRNFVQK